MSFLQDYKIVLLVPEVENNGVVLGLISILILLLTVLGASTVTTVGVPVGWDVLTFGGAWKRRRRGMGFGLTPTERDHVTRVGRGRTQRPVVRLCDSIDEGFNSIDNDSVTHHLVSRTVDGDHLLKFWERLSFLYTPSTSVGGRRCSFTPREVLWLIGWVGNLINKRPRRRSPSSRTPFSSTVSVNPSRTSPFPKSKRHSRSLHLLIKVLYSRRVTVFSCNVGVTEHRVGRIRIVYHTRPSYTTKDVTIVCWCLNSRML